MGATSFSIDLKVGETLSLDGGRVLLTLVEKSGKLARLALVAQAEVKVVKGKKESVGLATIQRGLTPKP